MAWELIKHTCGHEQDHQIYGTNVNGEREKKAEWLATMACGDCRWQNRQAEATEWADSNGLPSLDGTPKQVAWANTLRRTAVETHLEWTDVAVSIGADKARFHAALIAEAATHTNAQQWIDHRHNGEWLWRGALNRLPRNTAS